MIGIIDYGVGNINAFANIYKRLNMSFTIIKTKSDFANVTKLILPGVGAFDHTMTKLNNSGFRDLLDQLVLQDNIPILGICVGMQLLADSSEEGELPGLGWIKGEVKSLQSNYAEKSANIPLPHMGWNEVNTKCQHPLFKDFDEHSRFYFLHSYYFVCNNKENEIASTSYDIEFSSVIQSGHIFGMQCHPEKSHHNGVQFLKNFGEL